ncbi:cellulase family glycosylhydrolase [Nonomuraea sp. NN258]|nr:cellulase family glycosylhydrolase [Nonomuraea antri]
MGLNHVRLPIGWTTLLHTDGTWRADPWSKIDWAVAELASRGIYTLLDLHTVPGGGCPWGSCGRIGPNPNGFWGTPAYQDWTEDIWTAIATRYAGNPAVAGYDLINEPLLDFAEDADDVAQKSAAYDRLYDAVRAVDPDHVIVMGAFFGYNAIAPPATHGWTNVVYELHPYDMPRATDWNAQNQLVTDQLDTLPGLLADPGVPVLFGEYSLYYYDDVWARWMAGINARQQSWSSWSYKVRGTDADGQGYWGLYYNRPAPVPVINSDGSATFVRKLQRFATSTFTRNERLAATVAKYAGGLSSFNPVDIPRTAWTATASGTGGSGTLSGGIDGDSATKWNSGADQVPGQWYQIDLGATRTIAMVTVRTPASSATTDYMRGYRLEFSTDGSTWTTVGTGIGFGWKRSISVSPQSARHVRITQTGTSTYWWSIDEVTMYSSY